MKSVLLVHGAWHGAWCWHRVLDGLRAEGIPALAVDLPLQGLAIDAEAARRALAELDGDVVACGHSYGGFVISRLASPDLPPTRVTDLVFLCAIMTPEGTDVGAMLAEHGSELLSGLVATDRGLEVADEVLVPALYADCGDDDIALARRSLRPMPFHDPAPPPVRPGYPHVRSTYVVCEQDRAIPVSLQRVFADAADRVVDVPASHSPFFSAPDRVVEVLASLVTSR